MGDLVSDSIYQAFTEAARKNPDKLALAYLGNEYSYSQLKDVVERCAAGLGELGVAEDDRVIIYLPNSVSWVIAWLALQRIGAVAVPIPPIYTPRDLKYIAKDSEATTIFCADTNFGYVTEVLPETSLKRVIVSNIIELLPWWKKVIAKAFDRTTEGEFALGKNVYSFKSLLRKTSSSLPPVRPQGKKIAELLYTGGTTGFPKGVPLSNIHFMRRVTQFKKFVDTAVPRGQEVVIQASPLFHILGQGGALRVLLQGETLILLPRMNLDGMFDHIQRYKATTFFGAPAMFRMILEHDRLDNYDLSSIKYILGGADIFPLEIADRWLKKFGQPIYMGYGATELGGAITLTPGGGEAFPVEAAGKLLPSETVKLVYPGTLEVVPPGEEGELLVSSENMITGYWNKPEETRECFVESDGRLWYRTKDIVKIDKDSWLYFVDRSADLIKHKGYRVSASKIEAVLQEHPAVIASCVVGVADPKVGERIKAFVVLKEDVRGVGAYDLLHWCRERLASYEVPQYIEFRDMLPKSKVGKVLRREMRAEERRKMEEA